MDIVYEFNPGLEEIDFLEQKLIQFNRSRIDQYTYDHFIIKVLNDSRRMIAGIHGQVGGGWLYIAALWVSGKYRGQGLGIKLVGLAEKTALKKHCIGAHLYTYSFQNPGFYEKLGYKVFGTLENYCDSHAKLFMKKNLN
jgi:predicted N-acetyltransferase YhbS